MSYIYEYWENGTWVLKPTGYTPSGPGYYNFYQKDFTTSPMKIRKVDLAEGGNTMSRVVVQGYTWCDWGFKWANQSVTETRAETVVGGYFPLYKFPLDYSLTWQISGVRMQHVTGTEVDERDAAGNTDTYAYDITPTPTPTPRARAGRTPSSL